jgi:hypothetical protein
MKNQGLQTTVLWQKSLIELLLHARAIDRSTNVMIIRVDFLKNAQFFEKRLLRIIFC